MVCRDGVGFDASWSKWQRERTACVKQVRLHAVDRRAWGLAQLLLKGDEQLARIIHDGGQ